MEVKKITKTIEEVVGYVAFDGTEFKDKAECEKYENTAEAIINHRFAESCVKHMMVDSMATEIGDGYWEAGCGEEYYSGIVQINNDEELQIALMFQELHCKSAKRKFSTSDYGKDLVVYLGEREYKTGRCIFENCYIWGTIDECAEQFRKALMNFYEFDNNGKEISKEDATE